MLLPEFPVPTFKITVKVELGRAELIQGLFKNCTYSIVGIGIVS